MSIFSIFSWERIPKDKLLETDRLRVKQTIQEAFDRGDGSVELSQVYIERLPKEFEDLRNLVWIAPNQQITSQIQLYMSMNFLNHFPREILSLKNLTVLIFKRNYVKVLPPEIGSLSNLKELSVSHNLLEYLPQTLFNLKKLELFIGHPNPYMKMPQNKMVLVGKDAQALSLKELSLRAIKRDGVKTDSLLSKHRLLLNTMEGHRCAVCNTRLCESVYDIFLWLKLLHSSQRYPFQFRFCSAACLKSSCWEEMREQLLSI